MEESTENQEKVNRRRIDTSLIIALVALGVSMIGTITSVYEARILRKQQEIMYSQQEIMQDQKSAAAWPYVTTQNSLNHLDVDRVVIYTHTIENKGVGPAQLSDVDYRYQGQSYETYTLDEALTKDYPDIQFSLTQNWQVDHIVLSAGEVIKVFTLRIEPTPSFKGDISRVANRITNDYESRFCYCSVFNDCWAVSGAPRPSPITDCTLEFVPPEEDN